jgi:glutamate carboxypeptidase
MLKFEGGLKNTLVTTRKGLARYRLNIKGKDAHFGNLKVRKVSAIDELAYKIRAIEALNLESNISANVGKVEGGLASNKMSASASIEFELRSWDNHILKNTISELEKPIVLPSVKGCKLALEGLANIPPWQPTRKSKKLLNLACQTSDKLRFELREEKRGGVSDSNWVASSGIPALDGLGPLGNGDFTKNEFIVKKHCLNE